MIRLPRTLLARTFLLIALLLLISQAYWIAVFRFADHEPRSRQLARTAASMVQLTRAALLASSAQRRAILLSELSANEGIMIVLAEDNLDIEYPEANNRFYADIQRNLLPALGPGTRFARAINQRTGLWVSFSVGDSSNAALRDEYWIGLLRDHHREPTFPWQWVLWTTLAALLSMVCAWIIVGRINRPLKQMAEACTAIGQGQRLAVIDERGPSEIASLAKALNTMTGDLARLEDERAEVLAGISHDLRTPLARLRLAAELSSDDSLREGMSSDIDQINALLGQFLDYARGDNGEPLESCDAEKLLAGVVAPYSGVSLDCAALPPCRLRQRAIQRALGNLIDNAHKYGLAPITVHASMHENALQIDVEDCGPGIPAAEVERLKRPFTRHDEARGGPSGTGLGLAIVDRIARLHGGRLDLLPRADGGLIARLSLPQGE
jgi:two-component system osmolarity sensor histidine kinase EnvZ